MKKLVNNSKVTVADMLRPTEYEMWEKRECIREIVLTYLSCVIAFLMLIGVVIIL